MDWTDSGSFFALAACLPLEGNPLLHLNCCFDHLLGWQESRDWQKIFLYTCRLLAFACLLVGGGNSLASKTSLHLPLLTPCDHLIGWTDLESFFAVAVCLPFALLASSDCLQAKLPSWVARDYGLIFLYTCRLLAFAYACLLATSHTLRDCRHPAWILFAWIVTSQMFFQILACCWESEIGKFFVKIPSCPISNDFINLLSNCFKQEIKFLSHQLQPAHWPRQHWSPYSRIVK